MVRESASPKAPRPSTHGSPRRRCGSGTILPGSVAIDVTCIGSSGRGATDATPRRRPDALPAGRVREPRAAATRCARGTHGASGRRPVARHRAGMARRSQRGQGVGRLRSQDGRRPRVRTRLLARADVVLEGFRPGVAERLGVGPDDARAGAVYCSITGFGLDNRHEQRAGTTSTTSAGPARSPTRRRRCRRCRSQTSRPARSAL